MTRQHELAQVLALATESLREAQAARAHSTELTAQFGSLMVNEVLEVGTGVIDASGQFSRDFRAPYAAVSVVAPVVPLVAFGTVAGAGPDLVVSLPVGSVLTGFDLSSARPGTNLAGSVVVTGVQGGPFTEFVPISSGSGLQPLPVRFGEGLLATDVNTAPTVTVPSIATGPALYLTVYGRNGRLVVTNSPRQGTPPGSGVGLFDVPPGCGMTRRMVGSTLTVYGAAGQRFSYTAFVRPQPETFGRLS